MSIGDWSPLALAARVRSYWRGLRRRDAIEADLTEEFRHHVELRTADLVRDGLSWDEAARQARLEFGHMETHRIDARAARGLASVDQIRFSALDVKLGVRMLLKYPGLSLVSVTGMAVAIALGAGVFSVIASLMETTLPLPEGDRVVAVRNAVITEPGQNRASLRDFTAWRDELQSVQDLAAFTTGRRNLVVPGAGVEPVRVVRMTAAGFRIARTAPVLGRPLLDEDERSDARVVVIAFDEWQRRFAADPDIIGRRIGLGSDVYTVVGVMPAEFRFPVDDPAGLRARGARAGRCGFARDIRTSGRRRHARACTGGAHQHRHAHGGGVSGDARAAAAESAPLHACVLRHGQPGERLGRAPVQALLQSAAGRGCGERCDPGVCAHGDARWRDRGANGIGCEPRAGRDAAVRGGAGAVRNRCDRRAHDRRHRAREAAGAG